jgi:hypothetical protein
MTSNRAFDTDAQVHPSALRARLVCASQVQLQGLPILSSK